MGTTKQDEHTTKGEAQCVSNHTAFDNYGADCQVDSEHSNNGKPLSEDVNKNIKSYATRFWILAVFSVLACLQTVIFGTFGPIEDSVEYALGWQDSIIAIISCLSPGTTFLTIFPMTWFNQTYGIRKGMLLGAFMMAFGTGLRCIPSSDDTFKILSIFGGVFNGLCGSAALSLPPMVAATWFPVNERTTATAVGALAAQLGGVGMYMSPLIVRSRDEASPEAIKRDIRELMYIDFGIAAVLFLCIVVHFPDKPPTPPSITSGIERENYMSSLRLLIKDKQILVIWAAYMFSFGIPVVWISVMNFNVDCIGITQNQSMWVGIVAAGTSGVAAFIVARITDYLYGYLRLSIIVLLMIASVFFVWFLLLVNDVVPSSLAQVYITVTGGLSFEYATVPLLIEFGVELAYPCSETVLGASLTGLFTMAATIFLLLIIIPTDCYYWIMYVLVACTFLPAIPFFFIKEVHKRSSLDRSHSQ